MTQTNSRPLTKSPLAEMVAKRSSTIWVGSVELTNRAGQKIRGITPGLRVGEKFGCAYNPNSGFRLKI